MIETKDKGSYIGFPSPLLGSAPIRLEVLYIDKGLLALNLPGGLLLKEHIFYEGLTIQEGLLHQLRAQKPELIGLGIETIKPLYFLEPELSGLIYLSIQKESLDPLRNSLGSNHFIFKFILIAWHCDELGDSMTCKMPLRAKPAKKKMESDPKGNQSQTHFKRIKVGTFFDVWQAESFYPRIHQIRFHASCLNIPVCGETCYQKNEPLLLSKAKGKSSFKDEKPLIFRPAIHLSCLEMVKNDALPEALTKPFTKPALEAPFPKNFRVALHHL